MPSRRRILLIQLPIPQPGMEPAEGNVPLAAGYLKLLARLRGLEEDYEIEILPPRLANTLSDRGLVAEILDRDPWLVGWTCYLWNIERSLDISRLIKERRPEVRVLVGGPEITADNAWVLERPEIDFAAIGEGEQTFVELLGESRQCDVPRQAIAGLYVSPALEHTRRGVWRDEPVAQGALPLFRQPLANLNDVSSPYLHGILDAADERMLLLETLRGCIFKCKFCYYPKSYDDLYFVSREKIVANLAHARERGAREVVLLDPTLNQRRDFDEFLKLLADCNPDRQFTCFGELRAEGINPKTARLLREANFSNVEIGLQSIDPLAQELMDRKNNLKAFERGVRALRDEGIKVKVNLIIGLPGDTRDSIRRSFHYLHDSALYDETQVFNLAVLPGTAFRHEAPELGLDFQDRPPYYVLRTPTLELADLYSLMEEAEDLFDTEFDPLPAPRVPKAMPADQNNGWRGQSGPSHSQLDTHVAGSNVGADENLRESSDGPGECNAIPATGAIARLSRESSFVDARRVSTEFAPTIASGALTPPPRLFQVSVPCESWAIDLDANSQPNDLPAAEMRCQAFTLRLRAEDFRQHAGPVCTLLAQLLNENPHTTLQVLLEPGNPRSITPAILAELRRACYRRTTYLDRYYSIFPGPMKGSKRLVLLLNASERDTFGNDTSAAWEEFAAVVWRGWNEAAAPAQGEHEYV